MSILGRTIHVLWVAFVLAYLVGASHLMLWTMGQEKLVLFLPLIFFGAIALLFFMAHHFFKWFHKRFKKC